MQDGDGLARSRDQAGQLNALLLCAVVGFPGCPQGGNILRIFCVHHEDQVAAGDKPRQIFLHIRMIGSPCRIPAVEKGKNCARSRMIDAG